MSCFALVPIVPPEKPTIMDASGDSQASLIGPYTEGDRLTLVCEVEGGKPVPSLTWWRESVLLDDSYEVITGSMANLGGGGTSNANGPVVRNELVINHLQRDDLMAVLTCQASNNNISLPTTATVTVDLNCKYPTITDMALDSSVFVLLEIPQSHDFNYS